MNPDILELQRAMCRKYMVDHYPAPLNWKVGIAENVKRGIYPLNGLRLPEDGNITGTTGWYIWAGEELSTADDFFLPLHVAHLDSWCPAVLPYLGLPPGWRFLLAPGYEDVWYDPDLLTTP